MVLITKLTRALGIRHPVVQGGMHHVGFVIFESFFLFCFVLLFS